MPADIQLLSDKLQEMKEVYEEAIKNGKYILSFLSIAKRTSPSDVLWKYEKVCLLIVDFESDPPEVRDTLQVSLGEGLVSEKFAQLYTFEDLAMKDFFDELYKLMMERYYLLGFR